MDKKNEKQDELKAMIVDLAASFQDKPDTIAEMLRFGSQFYMYSARNNMLIYSQNQYATYVQSFSAWKEMGASVKKGEKGIGILVPVQATYVKQGEEFIPLRYASKSLKEQFKQNKNAVESFQKIHFKAI